MAQALRRPNHRRRPCLESLEGRQLQATRIFLSSAGAIQPFEGNEYRGPIARFTATRTDTGRPVTDSKIFGGEIRWADGTTTPVATLRTGPTGVWIEQNPRGGFFVMASKTWTTENPRMLIGVRVTTMDGMANTPVTVSVRDAPKSIIGQKVTMGPGLWHLDAPVARFTDTNPNSDRGEFQAFITYTDPTTRKSQTIRGTIQGDRGQYTVYSPRDWGRKGTFNLRIQVTETGGNPLNTTATVREL
ncbi:MAG: hypothetical protein U0800_01285 [Isosphaeraceae bacterium]